MTPVASEYVETMAVLLPSATECCFRTHHALLLEANDLHSPTNSVNGNHQCEFLSGEPEAIKYASTDTEKMEAME